MKYLIVISLLFLSGCASKVSLIDEKDGCKIYRIEDISGYHYFSTCKNGERTEIK